MAKYGITWWGHQWLQSLSRIDFSNRLPRGRSYAGKGAVSRIEISRNKIVAEVKGSQPVPYDVEIDVPVFTEKQKSLLVEVIRNNPQLLSKLLNKELSPDLDALAKEEGIRIFPSSWKDFGMKCNCPDSAVPCKHLAAVLYIAANEIDKNPFILFHLHGMELLAAFENDSPATVTAIPEIGGMVSSCLSPVKGTFSKADVINIDLSKLSVNPPEVLALLAPSPVFCQKNFKDQLLKAVQKVARNSRSLEINIPAREKNIDPGSSVTIVYSENLKFCVAEISDSGKSIQVSIEALVKMLSSIEDKLLPHLDYSWVFLHKIFLFSLQLTSHKLFYPRLWKAGMDEYIIRYVPAVFCNEVKTIFGQLSEFLPHHLIEVHENNKKSKLSIDGAEQQMMQLCSIFINYFVSQSYQMDKFPTFWYERGDLPQVKELFALGQAHGFTTFETSEIPASIHQWLSVFDIHARKYTPVLQVEEHDLGFSMSMLVSSSDQSISPVLFSEVFKLTEYESNRLEILKDLSIVGNYLPPVNGLLATRGEEDVIVPLEEFSKLLVNVLPIIKLLGVEIILPKSLKNLVHPQLTLQLKRASGKQVSVKSLAGLAELLDYDWKITLGNRQIDQEEFLKMVKGLQGLVKLKDQYLFLDEAELKALQKNLEKNRELSSYQLIQAALSEEIEGMPAGLSPDVVELIKEVLHRSPPKLPKGLQATLRPYQQRGFEWMARNSELGMGSIIADDMGLGKTIQVICLLLHFKNKGLLAEKKALVIAPTSLISNWDREIARFAPSLTVYLYHGINRLNDFSDFDIVITSYGMVRNNPGTFERHKWQSLVVDEAQNIKNPSSEQTKVLKKLKADIRIAMSGTPVENRMGEYWSIFDFANKGYLGTYNAFNETFAKPIHLNHDLGRVEHFRRITAPFLLRRLKTDRSIITDLPDKVENNYYTELSANQAALYQNMVNQAISQIENTEGIKRKGVVLKLMVALKQIGNHPFQYLKKGDKDLTLSGKSLLFLELIESIVENDEKVLVFTQFREMGELLAEFVAQATNEKPLFLHGGCSRKQRDEMVEKFQNGHQQVFILSLKAGGTGLNLTAASHVIHYDLWWNPAVEAQATDRAYRIGQKKNVMVYRLINKGTIEEKIDKMIEEKRALADLTVATGETWLGNLSNDEIKELVKLDMN